MFLWTSLKLAFPKVKLFTLLFKATQYFLRLVYILAIWMDVCLCGCEGGSVSVCVCVSVSVLNLKGEV